MQKQYPGFQHSPKTPNRNFPWKMVTQGQHQSTLLSRRLTIHLMRLLIGLGITFLMEVNLGVAQLSYYSCNCGAGVDIRYFAVKHYHKIKGHSTFDVKHMKQQFCVSPEFNDTLEVVADGTGTSIIEVYAQNQGCNKIGVHPEIVDENLEPVDTSATDEYGQLKEWAKYNGYGLFKFTHPTKQVPPGQAFGVYYINFKNFAGDQIWASMVVKYYRPPVVMVHGLWSDGAAYNDMYDFLLGSMEYEPSQLYKADYKSTNDASFSINSHVVPSAVSSLISGTPSCGKVDVVCHSMGGILTRLYMSSPLFTVNNDIHRVITCNTPHAGSQMANWLLDPTQYGNTVAYQLSQSGMDCYGGAVSDLRVGQPIINSVAYGSINGDVQVHAIETHESLFSTIFSTSVSYTGLANLLVSLSVGGCGSLFLVDLFDSSIHDFIVAGESQDGGLASSNTTSIDHQQHVGSVANGQVMDRVLELLDEPSDSPLFAEVYSGFILNYNVNVPCLPFTGSGAVQRMMTPDVEITSPATGTSLPGGSTLNLTYNAPECDSVLCILRVKSDTVLVIANSGSAGTLSIPLPAYLYGTKTLVLLGVDPSKRILASDSITLHFTTTATLDSISMYPAQLHLSWQDTTEFTVYGHYSDNVVRDISEDTLLFEFRQMNAALYQDTYIVLDSFGEDSLVIKKGAVSSDTILILPYGPNFPADCHTVSNTNNDGPGSFREALACTMDTDTIFFSSLVAGDTIVLDTENLFIDNSVILYNTNPDPVVIRAGSDAVLLIIAEAQVEMVNIQLQSDHPDHICLMNFGHLVIENGEFFTTSPEKAVIQNLGQGVMEFKGNSNLR